MTIPPDLEKRLKYTATLAELILKMSPEDIKQTNDILRNYHSTYVLTPNRIQQTKEYIKSKVLKWK